MECESIDGVRDELKGFGQATEWNGLPWTEMGKTTEKQVDGVVRNESSVCSYMDHDAPIAN